MKWAWAKSGPNGSSNRLVKRLGQKAAGNDLPKMRFKVVRPQSGQSGPAGMALPPSDLVNGITNLLGKAVQHDVAVWPKGRFKTAWPILWKPCLPHLWRALHNSAPKPLDKHTCAQTGAQVAHKPAHKWRTSRRTVGAQTRAQVTEGHVSENANGVKRARGININMNFEMNT